MNWDAIGAVGQVLGSVAVFVALGSLAVQVKHARSEARRALSQGRGEAFRDIIAMECDERYLRSQAKVNAAFGIETWGMIKLLMEQAGLTAEEGRHVANVQIAWFNYRIQIIGNVEELSAAERHAFDLAIQGTYGQPTGIPRLFYEQFVRVAAPPDVIRYIDNLLAQPARIPNAPDRLDLPSNSQETK